MRNQPLGEVSWFRMFYVPIRVSFVVPGPQLHATLANVPEKKFAYVRRFLEGCMKREDQNHLQLVGEAAASDSGIP